MPVPVAVEPERKLERSPSLKNLKLGNIIQRSSSAEPLKVLDDERRAEEEARAKAVKRTGFGLWYYRFQLISGSYMLDSWESTIFSNHKHKIVSNIAISLDIFVLFSLYICLLNAYKFYKFLAATVAEYILS